MVCRVSYKCTVSKTKMPELCRAYYKLESCMRGLV